MEFSALKSNLKKNFSGLKKVKLALLSDSTTQFLSMTIRGYGYEMGYNFEIYEAPYGQVESELLDATSPLYTFSPEFILIFNTTQKLQEKFYLLSDEAKTNFSNEHIAQLKKFYATMVETNSACKMLYANFSDISQNIFGNYSNKILFSFDYQLRKLNIDLMNLSHSLTNFYINDLSKLHAHYGSRLFFDLRMYITADMTYSMEALPVIAKNTTDIIRALVGDFKKCLILDLDNTLWGGVIGDDGLEGIEIGNFGIGKAFSQFQAWAKQLKQRGIILAVCSQNHEEVAKTPFTKHPEMILKLEDISIFVANWGNKAENIKYIQQILNISFNSMVFIDDDPYQRNLVKTYLPEVTVPELPQDPAEYVAYLANLNLFETANYSEEDKVRNQYYQEEINRVKLKETFANEHEYLSNLEMTAKILPFDQFTMPRVAQLIQRTNQFNLTTIRYSEAELQAMLASKNTIPLAFSLSDKFGNYGIVSAVILKVDKQEQLVIDTWLMSCRVLKRGLENLALNCMINIAKNKGYYKLVGEYIPTNKNLLVKEHYQKMGFKHDTDNKWFLEVGDQAPQTCFITLEGWDTYGTIL